VRSIVSRCLYNITLLLLYSLPLGEERVYRLQSDIKCLHDITLLSPSLLPSLGGGRGKCKSVCVRSVVSRCLYNIALPTPPQLHPWGGKGCLLKSDIKCLHDIALSSPPLREEGGDVRACACAASSRVGSVEGVGVRAEMAHAWPLEECILAAATGAPLACTHHGVLQLRDLAPDTVSHCYLYLYNLLFPFALHSRNYRSTHSLSTTLAN
jgi:hypothetical protein